MKRYIEHQNSMILFFFKIKHLETVINPVGNSPALLRWICLWCSCRLYTHVWKSNCTLAQKRSLVDSISLETEAVRL